MQKRLIFASALKERRLNCKKDLEGAAADLNSVQDLILKPLKIGETKSTSKNLRGLQPEENGGQDV